MYNISWPWFLAGVEKVKEVKNKMQSGDELYVLMVAGLTDVLIKSVEEGKSKCQEMCLLSNYWLSHTSNSKHVSTG